MRFGLSLPQYGFSLPGGAPIAFEDLMHAARRAEKLGFDSVWVSDHFFYSFGRYGADQEPIAALEATTAIAGLASVTERVRLGSLVLCASFRHPALLAKIATTIDGISGGRFDLGIGAGWFEDEFLAFGYEFGGVADRFARLEESMLVLRLLFDGGAATMEHGRVRLRDARLLPPPVQRRVPVWLGGRGGDRSLRLAARLADGWNTVWRWSPEAYGERVAAARRFCEAEGRAAETLRLSVGLYSLIGEDESDVQALFERGRAAMPGGALDGETLASWRADTLSGTPAQVIERVRAFEDIGVEELIVAPWVLPFAVPEPERLDLFAEGVIRPMRSTR